MKDDLVKLALLRSFRKLLRPLVRVASRYEISFAEMAATVKEAMVEVAARDFDGEKDLDSATLAVDLGLGTADCEATLRSLANEEESIYERDNDRVSNVLEGWHHDEGYVGVYGLANELDEDEFVSLCRRHGPGREPSYIEKMMVAGGCLKIIEGESKKDRRYKCLSRSYVAQAQTEPKLDRMGQMIARFAETLDNNIHELGDVRLEKRVWPSAGFDINNLPLLDDFVREKSEEMLLSIDSWLSTFGGVEEVASSQVVSTGVGVYHYIDNEKDDQPFGEVVRKKGFRTD